MVSSTLRHAVIEVKSSSSNRASSNIKVLDNINDNNYNNYKDIHPATLLDRYLSQYYPPPPLHNTSISNSDYNLPSDDFMQFTQQPEHLDSVANPIDSSRNNTIIHRRDLSQSSLGSAGPSSPRPTSSSNPQIVLNTEDNYPFYDTFVPHDSHDIQKLPSSSTPWNDLECDNSQFVSSLHAYIAMQKQQSQQEAMPAPLFRKDSSMATIDGPPKLDRTMSDVYNDELYSPNFAYTSAPAKSATTSTSSPVNDIFSQRLQAANSQHLSAPIQTNIDSVRAGRSPFRQGSPLAPTSDSFGAPQLQTARESREKQKAENDALVLAAQIKRSSPQSHMSDNTISPKDALLDYKDEDDTPSAPLFPPLVSSGYRAVKTPQIKAEPSSASDLEETSSQQSFRSMATTRRGSSASSQTLSGQGVTFAPPSVPGSSMAVPRQYTSTPQIRTEQSDASSMTPDFPSTLTSVDSTNSEYVPDKSTTIAKPIGATADGGTYTCTYHGCTLMFETPAKLQKHKRDGHRQPLAAARARTSSGSPESDDVHEHKTSTVTGRNTQAGPHKCERINPSTGKPCNTVFSRPYDLTRHEDTIHNNRKQKVRCQYCTEEKTFSRNDALTRHMRVVHPDIDFPGGKPRRKGGD